MAGWLISRFILPNLSLGLPLLQLSILYKKGLGNGHASGVLSS